MKQFELEPGSYYGQLNVKKEHGKYFWSVENWDGLSWQEILRYLYKSLAKHHRETDNKNNGEQKENES